MESVAPSVGRSGGLQALKSIRSDVGKQGMEEPPDRGERNRRSRRRVAARRGFCSPEARPWRACGLRYPRCGPPLPTLSTAPIDRRSIQFRGWIGPPIGCAFPFGRRRSHRLRTPPHNAPSMLCRLPPLYKVLSHVAPTRPRGPLARRVALFDLSTRGLGLVVAPIRSDWIDET